MTVRRTVLFLAVAALLAGCGTSGEEVSADDPPSGGLPFGLVRCDPDAPMARADDDLYRDEPVYVGNEQPVEEVREWAADRPGFVDLWIDRDRNGWITVAFAEDADQRQAELAERFPDDGVVAVGVDWTTAELEDLRAEVEAAAQPRSSSVDPTRGRVEIGVGVLDEETLAPYADLAGPRLCVVGTDPADAVPDGPQPTEGEGWRLLAVERTGEVYRTGLATTEDQYATLWATAGVTAERPEVDLDAEVVVWFGLAVSGSCPERLDDVVVDAEAALVHGEFVIPGNPQACTDDANPEAYLVALDRGRLPPAPFAIQLRAEDPPDGQPEERTVVTVDLRSPGSTATDDQIGADPDLVEAAEDERYRVAAGDVLEVGYPAVLVADLACDLTVVGPFNGVHFAATEPVAPPPPEWVAVAEPDGTVEVELLLEAEPARLTVSAGGRSVAYSPTDPAPPPCP